jgi:hypothetical protein
VPPSRLEASPRALTDHRGDIIGFKGIDLVAGVDPEPFQHPGQALAGENRRVEAVTGAIEADDQAIADQHILAHTLEIDDVLDARCRTGRCGRQDQRRREGERRQQHHQTAARRQYRQELFGVRHFVFGF